MFTPLAVHLANATNERWQSRWRVNWGVVIAAEIALIGAAVVWGFW